MHRTSMTLPPRLNEISVSIKAKSFGNEGFRFETSAMDVLPPTLWYTLLLQDHILDAWLRCVMQHPVHHCSLHFDGVRVDPDRLQGGSAESVAICCREFEKAIEESTGYKVKIVEKKHEYFLEKLRAVTSKVVSDVELSANLLADGNCIPLAICSLQKTIEAVGRKIGIPTEVIARSYRECQSLCGVTLSPLLDPSQMCTGQWLLHCELLGRPHCVGARIGVDGTCSIYDAGSIYTTRLDELRDMVESSIDAKLIVIFRIGSDAQSLQMSENVAKTLLDLHAGSSRIFECDLGDLIDDDDSGSAVSEQAASEDEAVVSVDVHLHSLLEREVRAAVNAVSNVKYSEVKRCGRIRCALCPFRSFTASKTHYKQSLLDHTSTYHNHSKTKGGMPFVASGSKQAKLIRALYDRDRTVDCHHGSYLQRSSSIMRVSIEPPLSDSVNAIDKQISLVLDADGPRFANHKRVVESNSFRRVGHTYYTKSFAEKLLREALLQNGRLRPIRSCLLGECSRSGNEAANLFPVNTRTWMALLADVMESPMVCNLFDKLIMECATHQEFKHVSMDATLRCAMRIRGQASYRASAIARADAPVADEDALRRVLTIRGRTGAPLCMALVKGESAPDIGVWLEENVKADVLTQIETIASDTPSRCMFDELSKLCPNMSALLLDPVHLVIVYHQAFWRKRTPGQTLLRRLQAKYNRVCYERDADHWGPIYTGREVVRLSRGEDILGHHSQELQETCD